MSPGGGTVNGSHDGIPAGNSQRRAPRRFPRRNARVSLRHPRTSGLSTSHVPVDRDKSLGSMIGFP